MKWLAVSLILLGCGSAHDDPKPVQLPAVETILVSASDSLAVVVCKSSSTIKGVCWGDAPDPNKGNSWAEGDTVKIYTQPRQEYNVRAFAQNGAGTAYGKNITFKAICPSSLGGSVAYTTQLLSSDGPNTCPVTITGTTTLTDKGEGLYLVGDASFGVYGCAWGDSPASGVTLEDTCGKLKFMGADQYGLTFTLSVISHSGNTLVIQWHNNFGDSGITSLQW